MAYFDGVKVGDKVYSLTDGEGVVVEVDKHVYPIIVDFGHNHRSYTMDGFFMSREASQALYWQKPEIIDKGKPKEPLVKGAAYWVWLHDDENHERKLRIYSHSENGIDYFFYQGVGSGSNTTIWDEYELFKQPDGVECLLFKNTRDGMRELLDISHDEYREIYSELQELISKSENLLYTIDRDKDVVEKKWWLDERAQLSEAIENAKKH